MASNYSGDDNDPALEREQLKTARETLRARSKPQEESPAGESAGKKPKTGNSTIKVALVLLIFILFGGAVAYVVLQEDESAPPLITADNAPVKVEPEDRGGLEIPNQDKEVYERLSGAAEGERREQLLPPPEQPIRNEDAAEPEARETAAIEEESQPPDIPASTPDETASAPDAAAAPAGEPEIEPVNEPAATVAAGGTHFVQVGAWRQRSEAEAAWPRLEDKFPVLLAGIGSDIQRADLGARGIFYRLRAGPFPSEDEAATTCSEMKARGTDCLVVER